VQLIKIHENLIKGVGYFGGIYFLLYFVIFHIVLSFDSSALEFSKKVHSLGAIAKEVSALFEIWPELALIKFREVTQNKVFVHKFGGIDGTIEVTRLETLS
jgi:hypothetical protein